MGIGMVIVTSRESARAVVGAAKQDAVVIGDVVVGERQVVYV